jgi:hypothetical protein
MKRTLLSALVLLILVGLSGFFAANSASAAAIKSLAGCAANTLPANDDGSTGEVGLPFTVDFFGATYNSIYVNNNGNVTFEAPMLTFTPFNLLTTETVIIAPFFGDVDTQGEGSGVLTYGATTFGGRTTFCANWINVGYFSSRTDKLNSFQLLLVDRSDVGAGDFDIIMNYDRIQWETGNASGGVDGLGGSSARVGYSNGVDTAFELPGSATNGAFLDSSPGGLIHNSRDSFLNGRYVFPVRSGAAPVGGTISGNVFAGEGGAGGLAGAVPLEEAFVQLCDVARVCNTTRTNAAGAYSFTGLGGGVNYWATAFPPSTSLLGPRTIGALFLEEGGTLTGQDIVLIPSAPAPPNVTINTPFQAGDGTPAINSAGNTPMTQTNSCSGGVAGWALTQGGVIIDSGPMVETSPGTYTTTIPPQGANRAGRADMKISIDCPAPTADKQTVFDIYIDPSGTVRTVGGDPIAGATVTLFRSDSSSGPFEQVPNGSGIMSPSNRTNPDTTGDDGVFRWDVIAGFYIVHAEKDGCVSPSDPSRAYVETEVMTIPPPVTDLDMRLDCGGGPGPTTTPPGPQPTPTQTTPPGACAEDAFEDNDSRSGAVAVSLPFNQTGLRICAGDDDWYAFSLSAGEMVEIDALFSDSEGDVDIFLYGPGGSEIGDSDSVTDNEDITHIATASGTHTVQVELYSDAGAVEGNSYTLQIGAGGPGLLGDVSCNGSVDSIDAALILQFGAGLIGSLGCQDAADTNEDGTVNSIDAALVLQFSAGLIPSLPV